MKIIPVVVLLLSLGSMPLVGYSQDAGQNGWRLNLYPNPASTQITVEVEGDVKPLAIFLYDMHGNTVLTPECFFPGNQSLSVNISGLAPGTYFARVTTTQGIQVRKFVVAAGVPAR